MIDHIQIGVDNAVAQGLSPEAVLALGYEQIHALCGKAKDSLGETFVWEAARNTVAGQVANIVEIEAEDGTIITQT